MAVSKRRCKFCREYTREFIQTPTGVFCSYDHATKFAIKKTNEKREKAYNLKTRQLKEKARSSDRGYWLKRAQSAFNAYIRERDSLEPCISCGKHHTGQYHAGHYKTVGAYPELRFEELNCHKQCAPCNNHLSGNLINYRLNLLAKIGEKSLDWLESSHPPKHYTIKEIQAIEALYKEKLKKLKNN